MNAVITSLVFISLVGVGYSWRYPRNADQTFWAFRTCQRQSEGAKSLREWYRWNLPNDEDTHCYVKCVWLHLGLYNEQNKSLRVDRIMEQFNSRSVAIPGDINTISGPTDGTCKDIYDKTINFFNNNVNDLRTAFYGIKKLSDEWFTQNSNTKPKGTKISDFCNAENREKGGADCQHACSAYYYRLVDEDNEPIHFRNLNILGITDEQFASCVKASKNKQGCKVADTMYNCVEKHNSQALKILDNQSPTY
nr:D7 related protein [Phlebotomus duboscqi]